MTFNEIVICDEEYQILSQLANGGSLEYKLSSAKAPYFCRLVKLGLTTSAPCWKTARLILLKHRFGHE